MTVRELIDGIRSGRLTDYEVLHAIQEMKQKSFERGKAEADYEQKIYERWEWERKN